MTYRLDKALVELGLTASRERAQQLIRTGCVTVNGTAALKSSTSVSTEDDIRLTGENIPYVSRGGLKLEGAVRSFKILLQDKICLDIGASTGGFTDCMLQNGAKKVWAVDVGHGQLAEKLKNDPRVVNMEGRNIRSLAKEDISDKIDFFSVDVSFISLWHIFPVVAAICPDACTGVCLIKPQFEAGPSRVGKKGVVHDPAVHTDVIRKVIADAAVNGFYPVGLDTSPIRGPEGNVEFLLYLSREKQVGKIEIERVVREAHGKIKKEKED